MKKWLTIIIAVFLILCTLLTSCKKPDEDNTSDTSSQNSSSASSNTSSDQTSSNSSNPVSGDPNSSTPNSSNPNSSSPNSSSPNSSYPNSSTPASSNPTSSTPQEPVISDELSNDYFVVTSYGAKGNGSSDDTNAINAAINAAKSGGVVYFPSGSYKVSSITFPKDVTPAFQNGAKLIQSGNIVIESGYMYAGFYQIFAGSGTVSGFQLISNVYPQWWGAVTNDGNDDSAAVQKAVDASGNVFFTDGVYNINTQINFNKLISANGHCNLTGSSNNSDWRKYYCILFQCKQQQTKQSYC